jgi:hypothetical protein
MVLPAVGQATAASTIEHMYESWHDPPDDGSWLAVVEVQARVTDSRP